MLKKLPVNWFLCCLIFALSGCGVNEPERYYNNEVKSQFDGEMKIDLQPGTHLSISTSFYIYFVPSELPVKKIIVYLDNEKYQEITKKPFCLNISQYMIPKGDHKFYFYVVMNDNGLYSAYGIPQLVTTIPFVMDPFPY